MSATHLVVLGNAVTVRWVLANQRMAFTEVGRRSASRLSRGDTLLFYASNKCWPTLGGSVRPTSGVLIGNAVVLTDISRLRAPAHIGGRRFDYACEVFFESLAPLGSGVAIGPVKDELKLTAGRANYGQVLQRTPVLLATEDAHLLTARLKSLAKPFEVSVEDYLRVAGNGEASN